MDAASKPVLDVRGVFDRFGGVEALAGDNGAGKSTLTRMISGVFPDNAGKIRLDGRPLRFAGIGTTDHDLARADDLSTDPDIFLGRDPIRLRHRRRARPRPWAAFPAGSGRRWRSTRTPTCS